MCDEKASAFFSVDYKYYGLTRSLIDFYAPVAVENVV